MANFSAAQLEYLSSQRLGRLATVGKDGMPHVTPTSFRHNPELDAIDVGGRGIAASKKYRDVAREGRAAIVIDDVEPPWKPRGIEIRGRAETQLTGGDGFGRRGFDPEVIRIWPDRVRAWGIEDR